MVESLEREAWPMQLPVIYDGLDERKGFDRDFLKLDNDVVVERPRLTAKGKKVAAPLLGSGDFELKYHKFSVIMHKTRRMALLTAANVDWSPALRKVNGRKPSRIELSEIPPNTIELWTTDERIDARHQLPDRFYTDDGGAFDKGHLVRRDDVCWGSSFEDIQMANGDTYHTTNCSPQILSLNQASRGDYNWGDFEGEIQRITKSEKIILFSGPVLEAKDRWFRGSDDDGALRLQVPRRFWKIVVAKGDNGPEAFGFIFEQDIRAITEVEFAVSADWVHAMVPIRDIKTLLRGWVNLSALEAIDQYDREHG
jgi:endonuclease G